MLKSMTGRGRISAVSVFPSIFEFQLDRHSLAVKIIKNMGT